MIITISGLPGSGTTTVSKRLHELTGFELVSAGSIFRKMATEKNMSLEEFGKLADSDLKIDRELDYRMCQTARLLQRNNLILEGRLAAQVAGSFYPEEVLTVLISATGDTRYLRIADREGITFEEALETTSIRESNELIRHCRNYGKNLSTFKYDLAICSEKLSAEKIADIIFSALPNKIIYGCLVI